MNLHQFRFVQEAVRRSLSLCLERDDEAPALRGPGDRAGRAGRVAQARLALPPRPADVVEVRGLATRRGGARVDQELHRAFVVIHHRIDEIESFGDHDVGMLALQLLQRGARARGR